jgi:hypothetical protein
MLEPKDVLSIEAFRAARPRLEREVLQAKALRRLHVGPHFTFLFENRQTLLWQIQEMCRVENITSPDGVRHEVETYGALLPGPAELSATLLVEYDEPTERDRMLHTLVGVHEVVGLEIAGVPPVRAVFDREQFDAKRISSVQFVRFPMDAAQRAAFLELARAAAVRVDHAAYRHVAALPPSMRGALVEDLATEG